MANTTNFNWETPDDTDLVKDGAAAIRTLGSAIDTSLVDLKGGTTNQVLAKNSNTDMDFKWVADAAGMTNPMTTTGDVIYSSSGSTPARLGIGTAGQVLKVNSGATAPEWGAAGGAGANWTLLNSGGTALTAAQTITVSGISGADKIMVIIDNASSASANGYVQYRFNTDTGSNYYFYGSNIVWPAAYNPANGDGSAGAATGITAFGLSSGASSYGSGYLIMTGANSSGVKSFNQVGGSYPAGGTNGNTHYFTGGYYNSASTISSVSIFSGVGNFDAGTVYVYTSA